MRKNTCVLLALTFVAASCAGPESYQEKMSRYTPRPSVGKNVVPQIESSNFKFKNKSTRAPASDTAGTSVEKIPSEEQALSNKKLYFLTLFGQYESMKKYSVQFDAPSVNICPQFHTSLLEHNSRKSRAPLAFVSTKDHKTFTYDITKIEDQDYVAARPELALPMSSDAVTPKVVDIIRSEGSKISEVKMNELVHKAIDIHLSKTYAEIRELCEFGVSDNYYIYENLITHIKNSDFMASDKNMNTLLKTTLFSNISLVTSLDRIQVMPVRSIASVVPKTKEASAPYANEVMSRLSVEWAKEYFEHLKSTK